MNWKRVRVGFFVGIARFSDSDSFPIHFFSRWDIGLNPFGSDRPCTRLCRHNKVGPGHLLKFSLNSIPKSAVFRAFLTEFSLNSTSIVDDLSFCRSSRGSQKVVRNRQEVSRNPGSKSAENFFSKESYRGERKLIEIYCKVELGLC